MWTLSYRPRGFGTIEPSELRLLFTLTYQPPQMQEYSPCVMPYIESSRKGCKSARLHVDQQLMHDSSSAAAVCALGAG